MTWQRIGLLVLLVALAAGCGWRAPAMNRAATGAQPRATATPPTIETLTWSVWGNGWELSIDEQVARLFEAEHPDVHIEIVHHGWTEYYDWLAHEWANERSPDVMFLNYVPMRAALGTLENLDPYIQRDAFDLSDFYPALLIQFRYDNHYYGLPRDNDTKVIYYNKDAFEQSAVPYPQPTWTWNDLRRDAIALTRGQPLRYGFGFEKDYWWRIWLWQNGTDIVDNPFRPTAITVDSPEAIEAVDFLAGMVARDRVTPPPDQLTGAALSPLFTSGQLAMLLANHGELPNFVENPELRWEVAPLPRGKVSANLAGGAGYVIAKRAPNKELAWEFVKYLVGLKGQAIFAESGLITPARRSVREDNIFLRQQPYNTRVFIDQAEVGHPNLIFEGADLMSAALDRALDPVWRGQRSAAEALRAVAPTLWQYLPR